MAGSKLILHILITTLLAAPATCCGQAVVEKTDPVVSSASGTSAGCPGHVSAAADRDHGWARAADPDACSGCALMAASSNGAGKPAGKDGGPEQVWLVVPVGAALPRTENVADAGFRDKAPAFSPGFPDTPVTRFDRLFLPG